MYLAVGTLTVLAVVKWDCLYSKLCMPSQEILRKLLFIDRKSETKKHIAFYAVSFSIKVKSRY